MTPEEIAVLELHETQLVIRVLQEAVKVRDHNLHHISTLITPPKAPPSKKRDSCKVDLVCLDMSTCNEILLAQNVKVQAGIDAKKLKLDKEAPVIDVLVRHGYLQSDQKLTLEAMKKFITRNRQSFPHYKTAACKDKQFALLLDVFTGDEAIRGPWMAAAPAAMPTAPPSAAPAALPTAPQAPAPAPAPAPAAQVASDRP